MCAHALADERRRPSRHQGKVLNLCLRHDRIVVVMQTQLHVYTFSTRPEKLCVIETGNNPQGLCALSQLTAAPIVAFPVRDEGSLQITNLGSSDGVVVNAHHNALVCFALNADATRLATASAKGTCIRIFDTRTGDSVREVRRGIEHSLIRCMSFYTDSTRLLVASDKEDKSGTIHMFSLSNDDSVQNKHSKLFGLRSVLPSVFSSEWSFCQFHLDSPQPAQRSAQAYRTVCAFGPDKGTRHAALRLRSHLHRSARTRSTRVAAWYTQPRRTHARTHTHPPTHIHARVLLAASCARCCAAGTKPFFDSPNEFRVCLCRARACAAHTVATRCPSIPAPHATEQTPSSLWDTEAPYTAARWTRSRSTTASFSRRPILLEFTKKMCLHLSHLVSSTHLPLLGAGMLDLSNGRDPE